MSEEFYILSLKWTRDELLCWWCPKNSGYTSVLEQAGRYSRADVEAKPGYYNNGESTMAIPCDAVDPLGQRVVFDRCLATLTQKRFVRVLSENGPECEACGGSPAPTIMGLRVVP